MKEKKSQPHMRLFFLCPMAILYLELTQICFLFSNFFILVLAGVVQVVLAQSSLNKTEPQI